MAREQRSWRAPLNYGVAAHGRGGPADTPSYRGMRTWNTPATICRFNGGDDAEVPPVSSHGGTVGFLNHSQGDRARPQVTDPARLALEQLRESGADPTAPHQTRHFVYVPGVKSAQHLARQLKNPRRQVEVDTSARKGYWLVVVKESMVVTPEAIAALRAEFETAAAPLGGEYDRWQVDVAAA